MPLTTTALGVLGLLLALPGETPGERLLRHASALEGVEYDLGGRLQRGRGIDCQGIIFFALERMGTCDWRSWSVMPTKSIARRELGEPISQQPMLAGDIKSDALLPGDVLYFLATAQNPRESALFSVDLGDGMSTDLWVWHMGIYAGDGVVLHADPFTEGKVVRQSLSDLMKSGFVGLFATRIAKVPRPHRCRHGATMRPPSTTRDLPRAHVR